MQKVWRLASRYWSRQKERQEPRRLEEQGLSQEVLEGRLMALADLINKLGTENTFLAKTIRDIRSQLNLDISNYGKAQKEVESYAEKIEQTKAVLAVLESQLDQK